MHKTIEDEEFNNQWSDYVDEHEKELYVDFYESFKRAASEDDDDE